MNLSLTRSPVSRRNDRRIGRRFFAAMERLESRRVLTAYPIGDANLDYVVNEADLIQVFQANTYEKDAVATWITGDWNTVVTEERMEIGDGRFDMDDIVALIMSGNYRTVEAPVSKSSSNSERLLDDSVHSDVELVLDQTFGDLALRSTVPITSLRVSSESGLLSRDAREEAGFFDIFEPHTQFHLDPAGYSFRFLGRYGVDSTEVDPLEDLRVIGSRIDGGGLQGVSLVTCDGCLAESVTSTAAEELSTTDITAPDDETRLTSVAYRIAVEHAPVVSQSMIDETLTTEDLVEAFIVGNYDVLVEGVEDDSETSEPVADATVYYDLEDGTIRIEGSETLLTSIHLHSPSGRLRTDQFWSSIFLVSTSQSLVAHVPRGMNVWNFPQVLQPGLDLESVRDDLMIQGATIDDDVTINFKVVCESCTWDRTTERWTLEGDFTFDRELAVDDVDLLCAQIINEDDPIMFDLNGDSQVNQQDLDYMIHDLLGTSYGDVNLDGRFNSQDFVSLFENGRFDNELRVILGWSGGDWNCDGKFDSDDLIVAFQDRPYEY